MYICDSISGTYDAVDSIAFDTRGGVDTFRENGKYKNTVYYTKNHRHHFLFPIEKATWVMAKCGKCYRKFKHIFVACVIITCF